MKQIDMLLTVSLRLLVKVIHLYVHADVGRKLLVGHMDLEVVFDMGLPVVGRVRMGNRQVMEVLLLEQILVLMHLVWMNELYRPVYLVFRATEI